MKVKVKVAQPCPTLCNPMDYTVHRILQARILEWVAFPSPGVLPNPGIEPRPPALQVDSLPTEPQGKPIVIISYIIWYSNRFIILFTQIMHKKYKIKENIFNLRVQYLNNYNCTSYITTTFTLVSGHPEHEIKILYYSTIHGTVL